ncbi:uncharacterized protein PHACADRAFT_256045 [Phanerochaete carnosa HHB-10118-sp]|uniref:AB hydrolase-1 domain-containing protein n=1 Tax=Phanerochaete carnosa (strain HHB-10118-sp) TaxID=650164 RepID=K5WY61_PHACS|nr:uncharacterized protein PHACADRAFT_256045 [Phanerochaete carnosa HHB-10118-sp]EKM55427.1 hypothetical protein PHACADRAFT_256045 [Phanerochaete carnosa HHB-10118-sp]
MTSLVRWIFGLDQVPQIYFGPTAATVALRKSTRPDDTEQVSLRELVERRCPSLHDAFRPAWWLPNGHLQTVYCTIGDFSQVDKVDYERTLLRTIDGGTIGLDFAPNGSQPHIKENTPVIVVLHGLTGGSHESYVRAILAPACAPPEQGGLGYRAVVVNYRGCAGVPLTTPQLYSAGHTDDIRTALLYIASIYPEAPLLGIGFSLGANVLTRYLAQEGDQSRLMAACMIGCPWDLLANSNRLGATWLGRELYSKALGTNLKNLLRKHLATFEAHPEAEVSKRIPDLLQQSRPRLYTFDDTITCIAGGSSPPFPFRSANDYYIWASSHHVLSEVQVPCLVLNTGDDPLISVLPVDEGPEQLNPWIVFGVTKGGGHLGWFEEGSRPAQPRRWIRRPVLEWLKTMGEDVVLPERHPRPLQKKDGWIMQVGRDDIGCRVDSKGGKIIGAEGEEGLLAGL